MKIIAGVDEVGRGSLIGPVYAAAVILKNSIDKILSVSVSFFVKLCANAYAIAENNTIILYILT